MLTVVAVLDAVLGTALGLFVSAFAETEFQAVQFMPALVLPQVLLCGLFVARDSLPGALEALSNLLPLSYAVEAMQQVQDSSELTSTLEVEPIAKLLARGAAELVNARAAGVSLVDPDDGSLRATATYGADADIMRELIFKAGEGAVGRAIVDRRIVTSADILSDPAIQLAAWVRERIRGELAGGADKRTIRRTHCEVVAYVDPRARKLYSIGGNVNQAVSARKLNLRGRGLKFPAVQKSHCGGAGQWTLPQSAGEAPHAPGHGEKCSLNDKKWFVLLQLR